MLQQPQISTPFPTRRSSDLREAATTSASNSTPRAASTPATTAAKRAAGTMFRAASTSSKAKTPENLARRRSEEHTSELQSPDHLVCRLLLEKKKTRSPYRLP